MRNRRDETAAIRALMLCAAGDEDAAVADDARHKSAERAAHMALRVDVGVIEHGVTVAANLAAPVRLAFDEDGVQRSDSMSTTAPISSASFIGRCAICSGPDHMRLLPSTMTSLASTSTPEDMLARVE
jgi:hypothetical protein